MTSDVTLGIVERLVKKNFHVQQAHRELFERLDKLPLPLAERVLLDF